MKNKKTRIAAGISLAVMLAGVIIVACVSGSREPVIEPTGSGETGSREVGSTKSIDAGSISASEISAAEGSSEETDASEESGSSEKESSGETKLSATIAREDVDPADIIRPEEPETEAPEISGTRAASSETTEAPLVQPIAVSEADEETQATAGPVILIGGDYREETYSCGVAGHHCEGPETHAYISNLELAGCKYCGSHTCPSFYGTDEWGNAQYTPAFCPEYNVTADPLNYCQTCGRPTGDGTNGTCVHFIQECDCPNCGKHVGSRECHTCE